MGRSRLLTEQGVCTKTGGRTPETSRSPYACCSRLVQKCLRTHSEVKAETVHLVTHAELKSKRRRVGPNQEGETRCRRSVAFSLTRRRETPVSAHAPTHRGPRQERRITVSRREDFGLSSSRKGTESPLCRVPHNAHECLKCMRVGACQCMYVNGCKYVYLCMFMHVFLLAGGDATAHK